MRPLTWKLILPLTVISLATVTKWWYVIPVDAPHTKMAGFPLAFVSNGWHTSMSLQIFVTEFIVDFLTYFLFWFLLIVIIDRYVIRVKVSRIVTVTLVTLTGLILIMTVMVLTMPDHLIKVKRDWDMEVMATGYKLTWQKTEM